MQALLPRADDRETGFEQSTAGNATGCKAKSEEVDVRATKAFLIGAGTAFLLDPRQGKRRRQALVDKSARIARRTARFAGKKARFAGGHLRGLVALVRRLGSDRNAPVDDQTVTQRIRSSAFRDVGISTRDIAVEVEDGIAKLRGLVQSRSLAEDLVARVRRIPGVREVRDELGVPAGQSTELSGE
jgi:BON domain